MAPTCKLSECVFTRLWHECEECKPVMVYRRVLVEVVPVGSLAVHCPAYGRPGGSDQGGFRDGAAGSSL